MISSAGVPMAGEGNLPAQCGGAGDPAARISLGPWGQFESSARNFMKC